jgi:2-hydroxychromene-2-carboxylate isomerase
MFATQKQWVDKISAMPAAEKEKLKALGNGPRLARIADYGGLTQMAAQGGVTPAQGKACLADAAALDRLGKMGETAMGLGVQGTPSFFINGSLVHAHSWSELQPLIKQAGG